MTREEAFERLTNVFREVFDDDSIEIFDATVADDIEDWDSFEHICIFRKNRALAPHERSAVPLGTDHCPVG